jgi:hypothetical protein
MLSAVRRRSGSPHDRARDAPGALIPAGLRHARFLCAAAVLAGSSSRSCGICIQQLATTDACRSDAAGSLTRRLGRQRQCA